VQFDEPANVPDREFELDELHKFNGVDREEIYISVNGMYLEKTFAVIVTTLCLKELCMT
jgi:hypothetical protein